MQKILVIDDDAGCRELLREALIHQGFVALEAANGRDGIELAKKEMPDLVVCDVCMDEGDGYSVLQALRDLPATSSIPFILMTGLSDEDGMRHGMEQGADDYLTKPFSLVSFLAAVHARLRKQAVLRQQAEQRLTELRTSLSLMLPHELLTPLVGILGFGELIRGKADSINPAELRDMGQGIVESVRRLQRLIQNFLLHARLQLIQGEEEELAALRHRDCPNARQVVGEAALKQASAAHRAADLRLELSNVNPAIAAELLAKLVEELAGNAFKFSNPGQPVHLRLASVEGRIELAVVDQGRGMSPEQVRDIGAYVQFERRFHEQQGTGLGLFLARRLAELHGGRLTVTSVAGAGTTVQVCLPAPAEAAPQPR